MQDYPTTPDPQQDPQSQQGQPAPQPYPNPASNLEPTPYPNQPTFAPPPPPYATPGSQQAQNPPRSSRSKWLIGGGVGCGVLLVMCMCVGLIGAIMAAPGASSTASNNPTATARQGQPQQPAPTTPATATATPKPTATTNPNAGASAYAAFVETDSTTLGNDLNSVGDACSDTQDLDSCRAAWVTIRDDSASYLRDLNAHPAPPCMQTADKSLRAGLNDIHSAALQVIDGIDQFDADKINAGAATLNKANDEVHDATSALNSAHCS